ncbi:phospholipase effector Tle1 domain-containing protein [Aestuariibius sp. 2305UL40-4]|uniref:phospholipase effector Tle1 domain-containing protein n=1 Tax=Aestuariibius violaceus TaxID=3234132 RepID=UPI00345EEE3C
MKRIAIFFDGTWNRHDAPHQTNVVLMSRAVAHSDADGNVQIVQYYPGVGSGRGSSRIARFSDKILGGALGMGVVDVLAEAYRNLVFSYELGDEIYVFGFSRGAYTARMFVGLLRCSGIFTRQYVGEISNAIARFQQHQKWTAPDHERSLSWRAGFAPYTATSDVDLEQRLERGLQSIKLEIPYVGLWDTVKSLAVPQTVPGAQKFNEKPRAFFDLKLSRMVKAARHAMALDERRYLFTPVEWSNLKDLNSQAGEGRPFRQEWFPGDHGSVGGGGEVAGLSSHALEWIVAGAREAGLRFSEPDLEEALMPRDAMAPLTNKIGEQGMLARVLAALTQDRAGPRGMDDLSAVAMERCRRDGSYLPHRSLKEVHPMVVAALQKENDDTRVT